MMQISRTDATTPTFPARCPICRLLFPSSFEVVPNEECPRCGATADKLDSIYDRRWEDWLGEELVIEQSFIRSIRTSVQTPLQARRLQEILQEFADAEELPEDTEAAIQEEFPEAAPLIIEHLRNKGTFKQARATALALLSLLLKGRVRVGDYHVTREEVLCIAAAAELDLAFLKSRPR